MIDLASGAARATVALMGAEARSWRAADRDLLWPGDPAIWPDVSRILYPVVGWTRDGARVAGRCYALGLHGFARFETFAVEAGRPDFTRLVLGDNEHTRAVYPFAFAFAVEYRLSEDAVGVALEIAYPGLEPAPYSCCLHPGFRWPLGEKGRDAAFVRFEKLSAPRFR
jgi:galactose mutarotase-like enzyme